MEGLSILGFVHQYFFFRFFFSFDVRHMDQFLGIWKTYDRYRGYDCNVGNTVNTSRETPLEPITKLTSLTKVEGLPILGVVHERQWYRRLPLFSGRIQQQKQHHPNNDIRAQWERPLPSPCSPFPRPSVPSSRPFSRHKQHAHFRSLFASIL